MKDISKTELKKTIGARYKNEGFNLYSFIDEM
jgi:hypothetical protein